MEKKKRKREKSGKRDNVALNITKRRQKPRENRHMKKDKKCYTIFKMMEIENEKEKKKNGVEERN